ncbi:Hypothetical predicted protein [Xyrichtys novacula]|uniref:Uncharacterized protein n=1 Tax=Xyrichtys novacula TaxID=13765 RepID=A0AAV1GWC2_XYRNO|nr:Hypothetical predicted protein [Xyrichtys novacula]
MLHFYAFTKRLFQHFLSLNLGPKSSVWDQQTPFSPCFSWASLATTSIPDISLSVTAIDNRGGGGGGNNEKTVTKGLQHAAAAMLCTVCLHAHDIMQDLSFFGVFFSVFQFLVSLLFNWYSCIFPVHYASDTTK